MVETKANSLSTETGSENDDGSFGDSLVNTLVLISPFFCWGTAMVAIKGSIAHTTPLFIASIRLFPAGRVDEFFLVDRCQLVRGTRNQDLENVCERVEQVS